MQFSPAGTKCNPGAGELPRRSGGGRRSFCCENWSCRSPAVPAVFLCSLRCNLCTFLSCSISLSLLTALWKTNNNLGVLESYQFLGKVIFSLGFGHSKCLEEISECIYNPTVDWQDAKRTSDQIPILGASTCTGFEKFSQVFGAHFPGCRGAIFHVVGGKSLIKQFISTTANFLLSTER